MKAIKENMPLLLLLSVVPYFFYANPTLPQAIIAGCLAALAGFKYWMEHNTLPDYKKMFEEEIERRDAVIKEQVEELAEEVSNVREKQGIINFGEAKASQRANINW